MKTTPRSILVTISLVALAPLLSAPVAHATDSLVVFGLTNQSILGAALRTDEEFDRLQVYGLSDLGFQGVSVKLGEADSGMTFTPYKDGSLYDHQFMVGHAYGKVGGIQRRVSSVYSKRDGYGTYPVWVDLLPLGSLLQTVEVYIGTTLIARQRHTVGRVVVYAGNSGYMNPRVNPFWRAPDGSVGVLLESSYSYFNLYMPNGEEVYGNRVFFKAENPLFEVDYLTQVNIFGGGPDMQEFVGLDERIGMFGRMHRALGDVVFTAKDRRLKLSGLKSSISDGVHIELSDVPAFDAQLLPVALADENAALALSASGSGITWYSSYGSSFVGPVMLQREDGSNTMTIDFQSMRALGARVSAFAGGLPAGTATESGTNIHHAGLGTNVVTIQSLGARGGNANSTASLVFKFTASQSIQFGGQTLTGDEFHFAPVTPEQDVGTFFAMQLLGNLEAPVTIVSEDSAPTQPLNLAIENKGTNVVVSWPVTTPGFGLKRKRHLAEGWLLDYPEVGIKRSRFEAKFPKTQQSGFFSLEDWFGRGTIE